MPVKLCTSQPQLPCTEQGPRYILRQIFTCSGPRDTCPLPALLHLAGWFLQVDLGPMWSQRAMWRNGEGFPHAQLALSTMCVWDNPTLQILAAGGWKRWDKGIHSHKGLDLSAAEKWWNAQTWLDTLWCISVLSAFQSLIQGPYFSPSKKTPNFS